MENLIFNEFKQIGVDYGDSKKVCNYELDMQFRDFEKEAIDIIREIDQKDIGILLDMGCGSGNLTIEYSKYAKEVIGVDISNLMIKKAKKEAKKRDISNIDFVHSGFLNYTRADETVDVIITDIAMHHLPDFWKQIALHRMYKMLKVGGILYIADQIYSFPHHMYKEKLSNWVDYNYQRSGSTVFREDVITSIKEEFSTFDWIIEGMLEKVGFTFKKRGDTECFMIYICKK